MQVADVTAQRDLAPAFEEAGVAPEEPTWAAISRPDVDHFGELVPLREFTPEIEEATP